MYFIYKVGKFFLCILLSFKKIEEIGIKFYIFRCAGKKVRLWRIKTSRPAAQKKEVPHIAMRHLRELSFARHGQKHGQSRRKFQRVFDFHVANVKIRGCCTEMQQPLSFGFYYAAGASGAGSAGISAALRVPDISR